MAKKKHPPTPPQKALPPKGRLAREFNERAQDVSEIETKFLVRDNDLSVFPAIRDYLADKGWIKIQKENSQLLSRQLDTADMELFKEGKTLRIRGSSPDGDLRTVTTPDICAKMGKTRDKSGAMRRGEYEARINSFDHINMRSLRRKYPRADYPELYEILDNVKTSDLREFFRIDCIRSRYVIELPESEHGLKGKTVIAEVELDDIVYVMDVPGFDKPVIFHEDLEIEAEIKFKPCEYNDNAQSGAVVSSRLNDKETDIAMSAVRRHLIAAAGRDRIVENDLSKAERGFINRQSFMDEIQNFVHIFTSGKAQAQVNHNGVHVESVCEVDRNSYTSMEQIFKFMTRPFGHVFKRRGIAVNKDTPASGHKPSAPGYDHS